MKASVFCHYDLRDFQFNQNHPFQLDFAHQVTNTRIAMENIAVKRKWRKMTHWVVTMVNYAMEAKSASKVGAVRMMPITNVLTKSVETTRQVPSFMNENCYKHLYFVIII